MTTHAAGTRGRTAAAPSVVIAAVAALACAIAAGSGVKPVLGLAAATTAWVLWYRKILAWRSLLTATILVILLIPIRRYALPVRLPFQLEPYRMLIAFVVALWLAALLADPRMRFVKSAINAPLLAIFTVSLASIAVNYRKISAEGTTSDAIKQLTFLASFLFVVFLIVGLVRSAVDLNYLLKLLVVGGSVVAFFSIVEVWTKYNIFNHVQVVLPFLHQTAAPVEDVRAGHIRVLASSQHPIALGALFVMLIPIAVYLIYHTGRRYWNASIVLCVLGAIATASRTAVVMLVAMGVVYLILRRRQTVRLWPALFPMLILVHFAMPGALGGFYKAFFPKGGLVAEQGGAPVGSSRVASLGPGLHRIGLQPLLGAGYGSRVLQDQVNANSFIVDDQWLSTGMDTGIIGIGVWAWLFIRFLRPMYRAARRDHTSLGWLYVGIAASVTAFAVGMLTYDAFSFIQTTFVLFFVLGLGCVALTLRDEEA